MVETGNDSRMNKNFSKARAEARKKPGSAVEIVRGQ